VSGALVIWCNVASRLCLSSSFSRFLISENSTREIPAEYVTYHAAPAWDHVLHLPRECWGGLMRRTHDHSQANYTYSAEPLPLPVFESAYGRLSPLLLERGIWSSRRWGPYKLYCLLHVVVGRYRKDWHSC